MARISFILVFSLVLALPLRSVLGQEDDGSWKDLLGQGGLSQDTFDQAQKAFGGSSAEEDSVDDFFGGIGAGAGAGAGGHPDPEEGSSLADLLDPESNPGMEEGISPTGSVVDSPVGAPEDLPVDDYDSSPIGAPEDSFSPAGAPTYDAPVGAPTDDAPVEAPENNAPIDAPVGAPSNNAPTEAPELAPTKTPEAEEEDEDEWTPTNAPYGAPTEAPTGEPDDEDNVIDSDMAPTNAPTTAPEAEAADEFEAEEE